MSSIKAMKTSTSLCKIIKHEPMSRHTSWRAGGRAEAYAIPQTLAELKQLIVSLDDAEQIEWLGLGSNLLVRDGGFSGTIVATQNVMNEIQLLDKNTIHVGAGVSDAKLARFCAQKGLQGAEFFAGIPGLVGGALAMNAGAWGSDTWSQVIAVETMNRHAEISNRQRDEFAIGYRSVGYRAVSNCNRGYHRGEQLHAGQLKGEWFIGATMRFTDMKDAKNADSLISKDVINIKQLLARRALSQPTGVASCGSVFRNPEADHAARLIESCGLKGGRIGGAVVAEKHANFIINDGQATAKDIESLIKLMQQTVQQQTGILLQTEVKIIGESDQ